MDRRDALKTFGSLMAAVGVTATPVTAHDGGTDIALVVLKAPGQISAQTAQQIAQYWPIAMAGTVLEGVKAIVLGDGMDLEIVRAKKP